MLSRGSMLNKFLKRNFISKLLPSVAHSKIYFIAAHDSITR